VGSYIGCVLMKRAFCEFDTLDSFMSVAIVFWSQRPQSSLAR